METVLIVDDEKNYLVVLEALLGPEGYEIVTADNAKAFADEYGLTVAQAPAERATESATPDPNSALGALGAAAGSVEGGATQAAQPKMSGEDFSKLLEENPQEAAKAYTEGRAPRNEDNVQARELVKKGIIDH